MTMTNLLWNPAAPAANNAGQILLLAHGAGAPADSPFMASLAAALAAQGVDTARFEFPYMQKRREDGRKRPPDRAPVLLAHFRAMVEAVRAECGPRARIWVGGKSMGGRMASLLASEAEPGVDGLVCFGYPFHPPGRLDRWRVDHFPAVTCPGLIVQGTRDPFGKPDELQAAAPDLGRLDLFWLEGGNHDFKPLARSNRNQQTLIETAAGVAARFMAG